MAAQAQPLSKAGIAFFSSLCASTFGLGCWQSKRYFEKIDQVSKRNEELSMSPSDYDSLEKDALCSADEMITIGTNNNNTNNNNNNDIGTNVNTIEGRLPKERGFQQIAIRGHFIHEYEVLVGPRGPPPGAISSSGPNSGRSSGGMSSSPQGYYVLTPFFRLNNMGIVLVNRGWVPRQYVKQNAKWNRPVGVVDVIGVASKTEQPKFLSPPHDAKQPKELLWMDRKAIEEKTKTTGLSPLLLTETSNYNNDGNDHDHDHDDDNFGFPVKPSKETVGEFKVLPSTHAGYAFTWFGLSGAGIFMTKKLITRGRA